MAELRILPPAAKYLKKLKDKRLKELFREAVDRILDNPMIGEEKAGDLKGIRGYDIYYNRTNYELAYTVEYVQRNEGQTGIVVVVLVGTRENFYDELKRYIKQRTP